MILATPAVAGYATHSEPSALHISSDAGFSMSPDALASTPAGHVASHITEGFVSEIGIDTYRGRL